MSLEPVDPPIAAYEAVRVRLGALAAAAAFGTPLLQRASPDSLALSTPHRVAELPGDRIRARMPLRASALMKGWRFLVLSGEDVVATVDAVVSAKGEYRFAQVNEGPFVRGMEQALRRMENDARVRAGRFEPLFLMAPTALVFALWLRDLEGDADMLVVIPPAARETLPPEPLSAVDFIAFLSDRAETRTAPGSANI